MAHPMSTEQAPAQPEKRWLPITLAALGGAVLAAVSTATITAGIVRSTSSGLPIPIPTGSPAPAPSATATPSPRSLLPTLTPQQANAATCTAYDRAEDLIREARQNVISPPTAPAAADLFRQAAARIAPPTLTPGTSTSLADMTHSLRMSLTTLAEFTATADPNVNDIRAAVDASDNAVSILCQRLAPGR